MDIKKLHSDICSSLCSDLIASSQLNSLPPCWSVNPEGLLLLDEKIYVPDTADLWLHILQYKHDHPISGHFGQNRTMEPVQCEYAWPKLCDSVNSYVKSCTTCMCSKSQRHHPYGLLKQLPIPERPWNSKSMDFIEKLPKSNSFDTILVIPCQAVDLCPDHRYHHIPNASQTVCLPCLLQAWCPFSHNLWLRHGVYLHLFLLAQYSPRYEASLHFWLPPWGRWTDRTH